MPLKYTDEQDRAVGAGRAEQEQGEVTGLETREATGLETREATGLETREATGWFTVDGAIEKIGFGYPQLRIYVICKLIVATDALEVMLLSLVGPALKCAWSLHGSQVALISTVVFLGMAVSSPLMGLLADHYGRRTALLFTTLFTAYFGLLTSFSPFYLWLVLLRGIVGMGMGGIPQGYAMVAEFIPSKYRAKLLVCGEVFWACGALLEVLLAALVMPVMGWRWLFAFTAIPVFLACVGCLFLPESVRHLAAAGETEKAMNVLQRLARANHSSLPPGNILASPQVSRGGLRDLFSAEYRRTTLLLWPVWFGSSFAYYGIVLASPLLFTQRSTTPDDQCSSQCDMMDTNDYVALATSTLGEFAGLLFSFIFIDKIGRRWTGICLFLAAAIFLFLLQLEIGMVFIIIFTFAIRGATLTTFNLSFVYTTEVYPTSIRAFGLGLCTAWGRLASMVTPFFAQMLMVYSVPVTVIIYGSVCLFCALMMFLLPIETLGRPLPQSVSYKAASGVGERKPILADIPAT